MEDRFKFRAWDKESLIMRYWSELLYDVEYNRLSFELDWNNEDIDGTYHPIGIDDNENHILMQCTNLRDKNGKLIYEGDVVLPKYCSKEIVRYDGYYGGWIPFTTCCEGGYECERLGPERCEVLGNIYENPGLLENKG